MEKKNYLYEARYIRAIMGWRQARSRLNYHLLNFILEEWMPWYNETYDFSLLEVNRLVGNTVPILCLQVLYVYIHVRIFMCIQYMQYTMYARNMLMHNLYAIQVHRYIQPFFKTQNCTYPHFPYRDVTNVCGFTREVLSALIANIETRELRRQQIAQHSLRPEHPRASNRDNIECFF